MEDDEGPETSRAREAHARARALFALEKDANLGPHLNARYKEVLISIAISLKRIADALEQDKK